MLLPSQNVIAPEANNTPQIMLLLHMQIRRYFNKICDNHLSLSLRFFYWNLELLKQCGIYCSSLNNIRQELYISIINISYKLCQYRSTDYNICLKIVLPRVKWKWHDFDYWILVIVKILLLFYNQYWKEQKLARSNVIIMHYQI